MIDPKFLRSNLDGVAVSLKTRGFDLDTTTYQQLEDSRKSLQQEAESLQAIKNDMAKKIGVAIKNKQDASELKNNVQKFANQLDTLKEKLSSVQKKLAAFVEVLPNLPDDKTPIGKTEKDNVVHNQWGKIIDKPFEVKDHVELAENKGWIDFAMATKITTARFSVLRGDGAFLHRALAQFMLDLHTSEHGYEEVNVPVIVNKNSLFGTGQLPKFSDDLFSVINGDKENESSGLFLIPTAEVPLTNLVADAIVDDQALPYKFVAHTTCFRSEAGNSGRDVKGLIRQHQFEKVELVQVCKPSESQNALELMTSHAEKVLQLLELPFQRLTLCTGDIGFGATFTYDLEVWLPSQKKYREISSISNCKDFQARRMKARFRQKTNNQIDFVHTLNGSGVAVGRAFLALLENHQLENGDIAIPLALQPYLKNRKVL